MQVDALGNAAQQLRAARPEQGRQLRLSVDLDVQGAGQQALGGAGKGAFVVMDVDNGEVLALGSSPVVRPERVLEGRSRKSDYEAPRLARTTASRSLNRAIQGGYPTGSTFKLITATAALEGGLITPDTVQSTTAARSRSAA